MENEERPLEGTAASEIFEFKPNRTYDIGIPRACDTNDVVNAKLVATGKYRMQSIIGSRLIAEGITTVDEFFKRNPLRMPEKMPFSIYEIDPVTDDRKFLARGSVLPKPIVVETLNDSEPMSTEANGTAANLAFPLFDQEQPREDPIVRAERRVIDSLRDELVDRDNAMERSQQLMEQVLQQNSRMMEQLKDTLDTLKETVRSRDEVSQKLAGVEAQVDAILKIREFEERIRKEREEEREQWRVREREWEKSQVEKQGLGDVMDQLIPFAPIIQMVLERVLPPMNSYSMPGPGMIPNGMPPGGIPPGAMHPGMMQGGIPPGGMQQPGTPPNGQQRPVQRPRPPQNGADNGEGQRNLNII